MLMKLNFKVFTALLLGLPLVSACSSLIPNQQQDVNNASKTIQKPVVQLWADNCSRCHNMRSPDSYSDAQWDIAVMHMRIRANLSAADARAIAEYLKSAN